MQRGRFFVVTFFKHNTLKAVIVAPKITVCFAGDVEAGLTGVRKFARGLKQSLSFADLLKILEAIAAGSARPVEFIVAAARVSDQLIRIRQDGTELNLEIAWIGDQDGFELFQAEKNKPVDPSRQAIRNNFRPSVRIGLQLSEAMEAVIKNSTVQSVGDFCVSIGYESDGFQYLSSFLVYVERGFTIHSGEDLVGKMVRPVEDGGYAVSIVEPAKPGTPALGLSFPNAQIGMLYLPLKFNCAQVVRNLAPKDYAKTMFEHFGVEMKSPMFRELA